MTGSFNVNDAILVKPTHMGMTVFRQHFRELGLNHQVYSDMWGKGRDDGRLKMPLWEVMKIFGPACGRGFDPPIETTVEFA